ncbi:MAG TPA: hypothetical protein VJ521_06395, partial [Acidobacteriota bacterium]|nr:hypothetical protein [Acidobacteriota bacterium]
INPALLKNAKAQGFDTGLMIDPFVSAADTKKSIDCAVPYGIQRVILDEFVSYQTTNLKRSLCTVLSEVKDIYQYTKQRYPLLEIGIDDNWHTWLATLGPGQSSKCGSYPYFQMDLTGVSVLSKYGNPLQNGACGHPTRAEMEEQLLDLKPIVKDYSKSGKIFLWQLNQHWYPGGADVLQFFRQVRRVSGWQRFLLFGPTADDVQGANWGYNAPANQEGCAVTGFQWYLPARDYLVRISEGKKTTIRLQNPGTVSLGNTLTINGAIRTNTGVAVNTIALQAIPPAGSTQTIRADLVAPKRAVLAFLGLKVNSQVPYSIKGNAQFRLDRAQLFDKGSTRNLVANSDFNNDFSNWVLVSTGPVSIQTSGGEKSLVGSAAQHQTISLSSFPIVVIPGRTYT